MEYNNFTIIIGPEHDGAYGVEIDAGDCGHLSVNLPLPDTTLRELLSQVATLSQDSPAEDLLTAAGAALFGWLLSGRQEATLRVAWDRAAQAGRGLRIRLSVEAPELNAWPWELLRDPARSVAFATSITTPLVRFFNRADQFGGLADLETELPVNLLLVLPDAADLDLVHERAAIEEAITPLGKAISLHVLNGRVTRSLLADTLLAGRYDVVHFSGHGAFDKGRGFVRLLKGDGSEDWVDGAALTQLSINFRSIKLIVLNACSTGQTDTGQAFGGLALQMVRHGIPAVVAMQFSLSDAAATTFAREFYRRLCLGEDTGQVDAAVTYARSMLAVLHPDERSFAAPALYLRAADGVIFTLPDEPSVQAVLHPNSQRARVAMLISSLDRSTDFDEDWSLAPHERLLEWRQTLQRAEQSYKIHLLNFRPGAQDAARDGLALMQARLAALDAALAG